jgi:hypothetical protein
MMNQTKKAAIVAQLKSVVPQNWKYSVSVRNHSTIVCTVFAAPTNLIAKLTGSDEDNVQLNHHGLERLYTNCEELQVIAAIAKALNTGNWNRSDAQRDYFDVGHYVSIELGRYDRPFVCTSQEH